MSTMYINFMYAINDLPPHHVFCVYMYMYFFVSIELVESDRLSNTNVYSDADQSKWVEKREGRKKRMKGGSEGGGRERGRE